MAGHVLLAAAACALLCAVSADAGIIADLSALFTFGKHPARPIYPSSFEVV